MTYDEFDLCGCSDEYGPCEDHGRLLAASGTGGSDQDKLRRLLVRLPAVGLGTPTSSELALFPAALSALVSRAHDRHELLHAAEIEDRLPRNVRIYHEDQYRLMRIVGGPLYS